MLPDTHISAQQIALTKVKQGGGSITVDFRTDDVPPRLVKNLNLLASSGRLTKSVSPCGMVHSFSLPDSAKK